MSNQRTAVLDPRPGTGLMVEGPLTADQAATLARLFKALGDPVRLRLLSLVAAHPGDEMCVCDLSVGFELSQPTISHHLKVLRDSGLLECERRGTWIYYRVPPPMSTQVAALLRGNHHVR